MLFFSVPADFRLSTLQQIEKTNKRYSDRKVAEVYGQITKGSITASGRMPDHLPQIGIEQLETYIRQCKKYGIQFNYTLNASCMGNDELTDISNGQMREFLLSLDQAGVASYTVALPFLIDLVKQLLPNRTVKASAICEINSLGKALHYRHLQVDRIVLDPDITRRFDLIRNIRDGFGENVEIIVNNACLKGCPYKMFHYNHEAHCRPDDTTKNNRQYYYHKCSLQKAQDCSNYIKLNWIRPEDLPFYIKEGVRYFKIHGRNSTCGDGLIKVIQAYMSGNFDGNLMDLLTLFQPYNAFQPVIDNRKLDGFLEHLYQYPDTCDDRCESCGHCAAYVAKSMNLERVQKLNFYARQLYENFLIL